MPEVGVGIIGGGLMGRELAATLGRWPTLKDQGDRPVLRAVADPNPAALEWFATAAGVDRLEADYRRLLDDPAIDVVYIAVPHHLHEQIFIDTIEAGKDFMGEKPFGIDLAASERILAKLKQSSVFARVSSEMVFFPGAQTAFRLAASGSMGQVLEVNAALEHSSDLDRSKPINWKRQVEFCGPGGVMADLGMHALHLPLRLGWVPDRLFAVLSNVVTERPDGRGGVTSCDTIDNATLLSEVQPRAEMFSSFPMSVSMKRIAPGQSNTWRFSVIGMNGGVEFSTRNPAVVRTFRVEDGVQRWSEEMTGSVSVFPTNIPPLAEFGFSDAILQMWAAFFAERDGTLDYRFGCATPEEAVLTHHMFEASLASSASRLGEVSIAP